MMRQYHLNNLTACSCFQYTTITYDKCVRITRLKPDKDDNVSVPLVDKFSLPNDIEPELSVIEPPVIVNIAEPVVSANPVDDVLASNYPYIHEKNIDNIIFKGACRYNYLSICT